jgi:hypothetical protein
MQAHNRRETMGNSSSSTSLPSAGVMTSSLLYDHPPKTELPYDELPHELQGYFQLRLYPAHCACQVSGPVGVPMTTVMASSSGSRMPVLDLGTANSVLEKFRILARYHGAVKNTNPANYSKRPIEMVAPITVGYQTRFVTSPAAYTSTVMAGMVFDPGMQEFVTAPLPEFASLSELPVPLEPSIVLGVVPARVIAVLPFSGIYHSPDEVQRPLQLLRSQLVAAGLLGPHDELVWQVAQYNAVTGTGTAIPHCDRRNELWVALKDSNPQVQAALAGARNLAAGGGVVSPTTPQTPLPPSPPRLYYQ